MATTAGTSPTPSLPDEIWLHIFSFVDGTKLLNTAVFVCSHWRSLMEDEELWEKQVLRVMRDQPDLLNTVYKDLETDTNTSEGDAMSEKDQKKREKKKQTELQRRANRVKALSWIKPKQRNWKWVYQAKTNRFDVIKETQSPSGIGYHDWDDDARYEGEWKNGYPDGIGIKWDGGKMMGSFMEGRLHGEASVFWAKSAVIFEGSWKDGVPHGYGVRYHPKDGKFEGEYLDRTETGWGKHTWMDGSFYEGEWKDGVQDGKGTYVWKSGNSYTGIWQAGHQLKGVNTWFDGRVYDGEYKDGQKHGQGTYLWFDGVKYVGTWNMGLRHGPGRMEWPDGTYFEGIWDRDDRSQVTDTNLHDWRRKDKLYDLYFLEDGEVWNRKYMPAINERIRLRKLALAEEALKKKLAEKHQTHDLGHQSGELKSV